MKTSGDRTMQVIDAILPLRSEPSCNAPLETELVFGSRFIVESERNGFALGISTLDGYRGYVKRSGLGDPPPEATHRVHMPHTIAFREPSDSAKPTTYLPMNARCNVVARENGYAQVLGAGWVFEAHLSPIDVYANDWTEEAERFLGVPYKWGGVTYLGLDCSGLVQTALSAAGKTVPRNSSDQEHSIGTRIETNESFDNLRRGDLVFFTGHVGIVVAHKRILHATGDRMAVVEEGLWAVIERRLARGKSSVTSVRRL